MLTKFQKCKKLQQGKKFYINRGKRVKSFNRFNFCNFCIATFVTLVTIYTIVTSVVFAGIAGTKHDMSITGTGIKAAAETQRCVFCHTPHSSTKAGPLWNHSLSSATYDVRYRESGFYGDPWRVTLAGQPDGSSRLCLGCHDGTVALGLLVNVPGPGMAGTVEMTQTYMTGNSLLGTNFVSSGKHLDGFGTGDHLVSMEYNTKLATDVQAKCGISVTYPIKDPATIPSTDPVKLYDTKHRYPGPDDGSNVKGVQCRSCHDPHNDSNGKFLVKGTPAVWDPLCNTCHTTCP